MIGRLRLRYKCPSCGRLFRPVEAMDHATQVVRRTCRCGETWQLVVRQLPEAQPGVRMDAATMTFVEHRRGVARG